MLPACVQLQLGAHPLQPFWRHEEEVPKDLKRCLSFHETHSCAEVDEGHTCLNATYPATGNAYVDCCCLVHSSVGSADAFQIKQQYSALCDTCNADIESAQWCSGVCSSDRGKELRGAQCDEATRFLEGTRGDEARLPHGVAAARQLVHDSSVLLSQLRMLDGRPLSYEQPPSQQPDVSLLPTDGSVALIGSGARWKTCAIVGSSGAPAASTR